MEFYVKHSSRTDIRRIMPDFENSCIVVNYKFIKPLDLPDRLQWEYGEFPVKLVSAKEAEMKASSNSKVSDAVILEAVLESLGDFNGRYADVRNIEWTTYQESPPCIVVCYDKEKPTGVPKTFPWGDVEVPVEFVGGRKAYAASQ
jgi:hypothetical protein